MRRHGVGNGGTESSTVGALPPPARIVRRLNRPARSRIVPGWNLSGGVDCWDVMLDRLRELFTRPEGGQQDEEAAMHLAAAVLLVEVAKADHSLAAGEVDRLRAVLKREWQLEEEDLEDLVEVARSNSDDAVSLHEHIDLINRHYSIDRKRRLLGGLWEVACADGEIHHHEELLIRRIADLLYLPHSDFIRLKHRALGSD